MKKKIETIIFDLDNTLYEEEIGFMEYLNKRIEQYIRKEYKISPADAAQMREVYHKKYGTTLGGLQKQYDIDPKKYLDYIYDCDIESFFREDRKLFDMLYSIKQRKVIFTNSPEEHAERILKSIGIRNFFSEIYGLHFMHDISKPSKTAFMRMFQVARINPKTSLFVDDSERNLRQAKQLGLMTVLVSKKKDKYLHVDYRIASINELKALLEKIAIKS